jgi:aspartate ammonia-lyase
LKTRIEQDSLGRLEVPANAYYGIHTQRAIENFPISAFRAHPQLIRAMAMVKKAAAITNRDLKLLDARVANAIVRAADEVIAGKWRDQFVVDVYQAGAGVSFHMNANEVLANRAIEILGGKRGDYAICHPNDHVNYGQSTNDVFPTAMRLAALLLFDELLDSLETLEEAFAKKGRDFDGILKSGRTHMMDAVPIRLGQEFAAYATAMRRCAALLKQSKRWLSEVGLGGSAVSTGVNTHPRYQKLVVKQLSRISGHALTPTDDLRYAMQSNLAMSVASSALRNLSLELIRITNDLRLLASGPNTGQLELNVMMPAMAWNVLHSGEILKNAMRVLATKCIDGIKANEKRCNYYANATVAIAAALNPYIGYAAAAEIAKESVKTGRTVTEIALERRLLDEKTLRKILNPLRMTEPSAPIKQGSSRKPRKIRKPK